VCTMGGGTPSGGCGCAVVGAGPARMGSLAHGVSLALALGLLAASRRRRRRSGTTTSRAR
jgi:hypothetical protein